MPKYLCSCLLPTRHTLSPAPARGEQPALNPVLESSLTVLLQRTEEGRHFGWQQSVVTTIKQGPSDPGLGEPVPGEVENRQGQRRWNHRGAVTGSAGPLPALHVVLFPTCAPTVSGVERPRERSIEGEKRKLCFYFLCSFGLYAKVQTKTL